MSQLLYILILTLCPFTTSTNKSKEDLTLNAKIICAGYSPKADEKYLCVQISVKNNTNSIKSFWIYKCTWQWSFISDVDDIEFSIKDCLSNYPIMITLHSNDSIRFSSILRTPSSSKKTFKLGLVSLNELELKNIIRSETQTIEEAKKLTRQYLLGFKIYWSNSLTTSIFNDPIGFDIPIDDK
jgi:hypothetical protein